MKTIIRLAVATILVLHLVFLYFSHRCQAFGYDHALVGERVFCVRTFISDSGYYVHQTEDLEVLQGRADKYIPIVPEPPVLPSVDL